MPPARSELTAALAEATARAIAVARNLQALHAGRLGAGPSVTGPLTKLGAANAFWCAVGLELAEMEPDAWQPKG
jgi:hypothetical protein